MICIKKWSNIKDPFVTMEAFQNNEIMANRLFARSMFIGAGIAGICWLLNAAGIWEISHEFELPIFAVGIVGLLVPACICKAVRGEKKWVKYMLLLSFAVLLAYMDGFLTYNAPILIVVPVVISCRYYSSSFTNFTSLLTTVLFTVSAYFGAVLNYALPDRNFYDPDMRIYVRNVMLLSFLPKWIVFAAVSAFCSAIARYGRKMVLNQAEISQKTTRVETELEMAAKIQRLALPAVDKLSANRYRSFDLAAKMIPAKEIGGDFYDFFYPDPTHLALIIADVADKGIAASLFMMMSKTMLDCNAFSVISPGEVLERVNRQLYDNTPPGMFVTVWLGILNLESGEMVSASAGHEYPALRRKDGSFELLKDRHGFVLGGFEKTKYPETVFRLDEGDTIFVYTDGVPEANNNDKEQFGIGRMLDSLNRHADGSMEDLIAGVLSDIGSFQGEAPQFDDTTMMAFQMKNALPGEEVV